MSAYERPRRLGRATAEQLLQGGAAAGASQPRLAALLAAAAPPVRAAKLPGEAVALAAFQAAQRDPAPEPRRLSMLRTSLAKLLTIKIGLACAAVLGLGGVAFAATGGELPGPLHFGAASPSGAPSHHPKPSGPPSAWPSTWPSHSVPPGLLALCQKYAAEDRDQRGRALDDSTFHDLIKHAGIKDRDRVDTFCDLVLHGGHSGAPDGFPSTRPSTWPKPSGLPTILPEPSGLPKAPPAVAPSSRPGH